MRKAAQSKTRFPPTELSVANQKAWYLKRMEISQYLARLNSKKPTETEIDNNMLSFMNVSVPGAIKWKNTISVTNPYAILELSKHRNPPTYQTMFLQDQARYIKLSDWNVIF